MRAFFSFLLVFVKIFIFVKVAIVLYMTSRYPESHPVNELIWWGVFLVFDMWLVNQLPDTPVSEDDTNES
jgi:hypothetical protein